MLNWANRFNICCLLDNQQYQLPHHSIECLMAAGARRSLSASAGNALDQLSSFYNQEKDWLFGHLAYDLKNELEPLSSSHPDGIGFPDLFFFIPEIIIQLGLDEISIGAGGEDHESIYQEILSMPVPGIEQGGEPVAVQSRLSRE